MCSLYQEELLLLEVTNFFVFPPSFFLPFAFEAGVEAL